MEIIIKLNTYYGSEHFNPYGDINKQGYPKVVYFTGKLKRIEQISSKNNSFLANPPLNPRQRGTY